MKKLILLTNFLLIICLFSSCDKDEIVFDENFELKYEEVAKLNNEDLQIKVIEVLDDSRCPFNAFCNWAGEIKLKLKVTHESVVTNEEISFSQGYSTDVLVGEYLIQVTNVTPETDVNNDIELEDYTFTFLVTEQ